MGATAGSTGTGADTGTWDFVSGAINVTSTGVTFSNAVPSAPGGLQAPGRVAVLRRGLRVVDVPELQDAVERVAVQQLRQGGQLLRRLQPLMSLGMRLGQLGRALAG